MPHLMHASDGGEVPSEGQDVCEHCGAPTEDGVYGGVHFGEDEEEEKSEGLSDEDMARGFALAIRKAG